MDFVQGNDYRSDEIIVLSPDSDPWENTVAVYNIDNITLCALPSGTGINSMFGQICEKSKYAVMYSEDATEETIARFDEIG